MIVGLKKRQVSKIFYDLALVISFTETTESKTFFSGKYTTKSVAKSKCGYGKKVVRCKQYYVVKLFSPIKTNWGNAEYVFKPSRLVQHICNVKWFVNCCKFFWVFCAWNLGWSGTS